MIKIGLFILPNYTTKGIIQKLKKIVKKKFGNQTYLNHLPHCSIYVFNTKKKNLNEIKKKNIYRSRKAKHLSLRRRISFIMTQ